MIRRDTNQGEAVAHIQQSIVKHLQSFTILNILFRSSVFSRVVKITLCEHRNSDSGGG